MPAGDLMIGGPEGRRAADGQAVVVQGGEVMRAGLGPACPSRSSSRARRKWASANSGNRSRIAAYPAAARAGSDGSAARAVVKVSTTHRRSAFEAEGGSVDRLGSKPDSLAGGTIRIGRAPIRSQ